MRCLFCKNGSTTSRSVEHIIPESLGNTKHILPRGIVCDGCNNYFARKVESPFLESPAVRHLRFCEEIKNKRGRLPSVDGIVQPDISAMLTKYPHANLTLIQVSESDLEKLRRRKSGALTLQLDNQAPTGRVVSRFLAKVALEFMAQRVVQFPEGIAYLTDEAQLDLLRNHARRGETEQWPTHIRTLYHQKAGVLGHDGKLEQVVHESEFLMTPWNEWFFVLAIFGCEFTINLGGPDIEGYQRWLEANNHESPLYSAKYGGKAAMPRNIL